MDAMKALRELTPQGSEYQTVEECVDYIRRARSETHAILVGCKKENASLRAEVERLTKDRDSLRALLAESKPIVGYYASRNPRWKLGGEWHDPMGAHALLPKIASALSEREEPSR